MCLNIKYPIKNNDKAGALLPLVAIGIIAIAGLVPFLASETETTQKLTNSLDETNKQIWALESAVTEQLKANKLLSLKDTTINQKEYPPVNFYYGGATSSTPNQGFTSEAQVTEYNSYLNRNSAFVGHIIDKDGYNLKDFTTNMSKPGVAIVNNTTYAWDKFGKLYKLENNKLTLVAEKQKYTNKGVWQVVSDGTDPIIVTTDLKAISLDNGVNCGNNLYQFAAKSENFQAGITSDKLSIKNNTQAATKFNTTQAANAKVEDVAVSQNHGLVLIKRNSTTGSAWEVWGWGDNKNKQLICIKNDSESNDNEPINYDELVNISDTFNQCKAATNAINDAVISIEDYKRNNISSAEEYFMQHYSYTKNADGSYNITNAATGETGIHHNVKNSEICDCPFCKNVFAPHTGLKIPTTMCLQEDQIIDRIECYINYNGANSLKTPLQFQILDESGNHVIHTFTHSALDKTEGKVFEPFKQILKNTWDSTEIANAKLSLKAGTYTIKILDANGQQLHDSSLFYGWKNRPEDFKQNGAQELKTEGAFFGTIFTTNDSIYNLEGGEEKAKYGYDVNFYAIAAGENFSLGIVSPKGWTVASQTPEYSVVAWGNNKYGQLGSGEAEDKNNEMLLIASSTLSAATVKDYRDMKAGNDHALFLTKSGKVYSWGGSPDVKAIYDVHEVKFLNNPKITYVAAGNGNSAALDENGNIYSWSVNEGKAGSTVYAVIEGGNAFIQ